MEDECQFHEESPCRPIECWMQSEQMDRPIKEMRKILDSVGYELKMARDIAHMYETVSADHARSLKEAREEYDAKHTEFDPLIALFKRVRKCARAKCRAIQLGENSRRDSAEIDG
ncbi:hypothetical protein HOG48_03815 [Candidatus Peregrinibacteria bacterium]|jgi:hypothetical protein|nr:hypothetical protein [Candidatus Peregrinibacteria bacterium]